MPKYNFWILATISGALATWASGILAAKNQSNIEWAKGPFLNTKCPLKVTPKDILFVLKNYNCADKLEQSSLQNLSIIKSQKHNSSVDEIRLLVRTCLNSYKPQEDPYRRIKCNLKYYLLKMICVDECEEGQILWELGFEEYPLKILANEAKFREPLFKIESPSDYSCISRNAYLALKKEAISDLAWKVNYLEQSFCEKKNSRLGSFKQKFTSLEKLEKDPI